MLAAVLSSFGQIELREVARPRVTTPDGVLVRVAAAGVCRTDLETIDGTLAPVYGVPDFPYVLGHETVGWVEEVGADVQTVQVGTPVLLHPLTTCGTCAGCRRGEDMYCTNSRFPGVDAKTWGGWAEYTLTSERAVIPAPPGADLVELASLTDAGLTAYHAVKRLVPYVRDGGSVVVIGVGGVGLIALQLLRMLTPARVIVIDTDRVRASKAEELGADLVLVGTLEQVCDELIEAAGGGADAVLDLAGVLTGEIDITTLIRRGGLISLVAGAPTLQLDPIRTIVHEATIMTNLVGTYTELTELVGLHARGLRSLHSVFPLAEAADAIDALRAGSVVGRAILTP